MKKLVLLNLLFCFFVAAAQEKNVFDIARSGTLTEIQNLNKSNPDLINSLNENKTSPLILACYRGNIEVAKFLIENVKDINYNSDMGTALMAATYKNQPELVKLLLEKKASPNTADANGTTALSLAVQFKNEQLVKLLLNYKADKTIKDNKGKTAFEYAVFSQNEPIINLLK
ncbi:ankyrin repeat domain-containing protein [Flavobacterium pectinovorum]|uniref:ankyrin repeat domain-containing protein n=1 Tax=Flavobacterium pectinovorum TaxID=29533 RepID=UPI001FACBD3C|nr:ankyrin repeat domain-containing protein [Flavobacterium pectinovorum]MCI9843956.1 ankyrin repeat domain-containing protein [Flavobacterium pectinovorum]